MRKYALILLATSILVPQAAWAAGFGLRDQSADAMGASYAGSSATGSDASYMFYNPAALGMVDSADFSGSLTGIFPDTSSHFSGTTSAGTPLTGPASPGGFVADAAIPALAARWRVDERWALGVSVSAPFGLVTDYPHDWAGRYYGVDTKLTTINIQPALSFAVTPHFILAAGAQAQYAHGNFSNAIDVGTLGALNSIPGSVPGGQDISARFTASGWGWGWTVGAMAELSDAISVGAAYKSSIDTTAKGQLNFQGVAANPIATFFETNLGIFTNTPAQTSLTTPSTVNLGARIRLSDQWALLGETDWINWSSFHDLRIVPSSPLVPTDVTLADWKDTWFFAVGGEYQPSDRWTLKAGASFDQSPVPDSTRGPRIPDSDRTSLSLGAKYRASDTVDISVSAEHLFFSGSHVNLSDTVAANALRGDLNGSISASANVVALQFSVRVP